MTAADGTARWTRIGILGWTFDPPHRAHISLAETALQQLQLIRAFFAPAADPPHKHGKIRASITQRLAMLERAVSGCPQFEISLVDVERPGPHNSVDTARIFGERYPGAELFFIMGADALAKLPTWRQPNELLRRCKIAVMKRQGYGFHAAIENTPLLELVERCVLLDRPQLAISSNDLLDRLQQGKDVSAMLAPNVLAYIQCEGIYHVGDDG